MNKELDILNALYKKYVTDDEFLEDDKFFSIIETALKELEKWKSLKISAEEAQWLMILINNPENQIEKLKALEIIIKHTYSGGWSGDYCTEYWNMNKKEIKIIEKLFKDVPVKALSER